MACFSVFNSSAVDAESRDLIAGEVVARLPDVQETVRIVDMRVVSFFITYPSVVRIAGIASKKKETLLRNRRVPGEVCEVFC